MSQQTGTPEDEHLLKLDALRAEFDLAFASAPPAPVEDAQDFVLVSAGGRGYALLAASLAGIEMGVAVVPVPSSEAALAGIAGIHGSVVPVFSLAAALSLTATLPLAAALKSGGSSDAGEEDGFYNVVLLDLHGPSRRVGQQARDGVRTQARLGQQEQQIGLAFKALERFVRVGAQALYAPAHPDQPRMLLEDAQLYTVVDLPALLHRLTRAAEPPTTTLPAAAARREDRRPRTEDHRP